ncbi:MAG: FtsX-like permease family protein [Pleurocapsa minor GSE-CHR-MK-17-07R]|jgi:putative ABC transport system permease protein|nr:FtsX-like permease family protein [Pleurocapsa minor GSE-CHR-MK 17-07R]
MTPFLPRFIPLALRYMQRRKLRTAFTMLAILFGVMVLFGTSTAMPVIRDAKILSIASTLSAGENAENDTSLDLSVALMNSFGMLSLFVGGFLIFNTYRAVLVERQRDLALLRIVGATRRQIGQLILAEALFQGLVGSLLGLLSGWVFAGWLIRFIYDTGILPNIDVPALGVPPLDALLIAIGLGIGTALLAAYLPARRAGLMSPLAALRPTAPDTERRSTRIGWIAGAVCLIAAAAMLMISGQIAMLAGFLCLLGVVLMMPGIIRVSIPLLLPLLRRFFPRSADIASGNIMRQPRRSAVTANSLMVAFAVFVASAAMVDAMHSYMVRLFTFHLASDYLVMDQGNMLTMITSNMDNQRVLDSQMVAQINASPEVEAVTGIRVGQTTYQGQSLMLVGIDPSRTALRPLDFAAHVGTIDEALAMIQNERAVFVTPEVTRLYGIQINDSLPLTTDSGSTQPYRVAGIVADMTVGTGKLGLVLSQQHLSEDFGVQDDLVLYLNLVDDADPASVRQLLAGNAILVDVAPFRQMGISGVTDVTKSVYLFALLVIAPALLGLVNTLVISIHERTREIGIMRAIGSGEQLIMRMVLMETLLLSIIGGVAGILAGLICGASLVAIFAPTTVVSTLGSMEFQFPVIGMIIALVGGTAIALLASLSPARRAARMSVVDTLRFE